MTYTLNIEFVKCSIEDYCFSNITEWEKDLILRQYMAGNIITVKDHDGDDTCYYINPRNIVSLYFDEE